MELQPDSAETLNALCWSHTLEGRPDLAIPYCQRAVEIAPQPWNHDNRGLAHALLGDYKAAIADLEIAAAWMEQQTEEKWKTELAQRRAWIETLKTGHNPLTPKVLAELRRSSKASSGVASGTSPDFQG